MRILTTLNKLLLTLALLLVIASSSLDAQAQSEWDKTLAVAKKEGIVVVGIPASSELRTAIG